MVGVLIRMRLRLTGRSLRGGSGVLIVVGLLFGLTMAAATAAYIGTVTHGGSLTTAGNIASVFFAIWTLGWIVGPILVGSSDETLQPEHLRLLPLTDRQLATGLLAAAFVGPAPVVNALAFSGLVFLAAHYTGFAVVVAVVGATLQLGFVVLLSRVVLAGLGAVMRSRRGKDLGILLAGFTGLAYYPMSELIQHVGTAMDGLAPGWVIALRVLPSGWAPAAVVAAGRGDLLWATVPLVGLAALCRILWRWWAVLLARRLAAPAAASTGPVRGASRARWSSLIPATPLGAVVTKELRTWWRDSRRRAAILPLLVVGLAMPFFPMFSGGTSAFVPFAGVAAAWLCVAAASNLYGFDGTAVWQTVLTPGAARADVRGRMIAWLVVMAPITVLAAVLLPAVSGHAQQMYPAVLALTPATLGAGAASAVLLSALAPYPVPEQRSNPFSANGNPGCAKGLVQIVATFAQLLVNLPALGLLWLGIHLDNLAIVWAAAPIGLGVGILAGTVGARVAERRVATHGPEILAAVARR